MANEQTTNVRDASAQGGDYSKPTTGDGESPDLLGALNSIDPQKALGFVSDLARQNPHATLAGGVAIGFLLGGGLTPRLLGAVGLFAARRYLKQTLSETMESVMHEELLQRR